MFYSEILSPILSHIGNEDNIAFVINNKKYSYANYGRFISGIRNELKNRDIECQKIGLVINDDIETYASILALWLEGCCYVPLHPNWPIERCKNIIKQVEIDYILDSSQDTRYIDLSVISTKNKLNICVESILPLDGISDNDNAYILFTSGSTGNPKGVQISRGNVASFINSMNDIGLDLSANDKFLQPFDLSFDFSVSGYLLPLVYGGTIFTLSPKKSKIMGIAKLMVKYDLTVLQLVPSMMRNLLQYVSELNMDTIRYNIFCGEALSAVQIQEWHRANPSMVTYNMYGPTEDTVFCTFYLIDKSNIDRIEEKEDIVSVGITFKNNKCIIIDENSQIVDEKFKEGELCLAGSQLTPGYWKNDKDNEEKFFDYKGERYYKSGDLCYYNEDLNFMYIGRIDNQVKINGFRVELGEIENKFTSVSKGLYSVVVPYLDSQNNTKLAIVIEGSEMDYSEWENQLHSLLPPYEMPSKFLFMETIPLNQNGKIDRKVIKQYFNL